MSWADEHAMQSIEDGATQIRETLKTGIHININGDEIDTREISPRYAHNLYHWYLRKFPKEEHNKVLASSLFSILLERMEGL